MNAGKKSRRIDTLNKGKLFELLIHYELDNIALLKSLVKKIKRNFNEVDNSKELVGLLTNLMNNYYKRPLERKDFEEALEKFNKIDKIKNSDLPYDEIEIWLKSKVEKKTMLEIAEQMLQNK